MKKCPSENVRGKYLVSCITVGKTTAGNAAVRDNRWHEKYEMHSQFREVSFVLAENSETSDVSVSNYL